tara:strand:+ start:105075 stop:105317 length:243 start_codon:yes stop_codon:yes gene_type:complete
MKKFSLLALFFLAFSLSTYSNSSSFTLSGFIKPQVSVLFNQESSSGISLEANIPSETYSVVKSSANISGNKIVQVTVTIN